MITPTPRWTADERAVIDRIARHIWPSGGNGQVPTNAPEEIFEDLKRAGVLIPVGGETRQEWGVDVAVYIGRPFPTRELAEAEIAERRELGRTYPGELRQRFVHVGPWREVTE